MRKIQIILLSFILVAVTLETKAEIKLPAIVSSNMVLQRNTTVTLWGWAKPNEYIYIKASWLDKKVNISADSDGKWSVEVKTTDSKSPQSINLTSKESDITLDNILFGEVWLCSGQSNMEMPVKGFYGQPTFGSLDAIKNSTNKNLRLFTVEKHPSKTPLTEVNKYRAWQEASPENVANFSSIAYFFGSQLQETLNVPVGLIHSSWGGSSVQAWISNDVLSPLQDVDLTDVDLKKQPNRVPTALYNGMINPIIPFSIKGAIWYQGESNREEPELYTTLFPAMVKDWRTRWGVGDFPFYYVQIAPYMYNRDNNITTNPINTAYIRESQLKCVDLIPNSGIAITMDIGADKSIHPPKKKEAADRLLYNALNKTYGITAVDCNSPVYKSMTINEDGSVTIDFNNAETGIFSYGDLENFEIAGEDKIFYPANAYITGRKNVIVKSEDVEKPVAVRYAWRNWVEGTLFDANLLPASSFRTDNWENSTTIEEKNAK